MDIDYAAHNFTVYPASRAISTVGSVHAFQVCSRVLLSVDGFL